MTTLPSWNLVMIPAHAGRSGQCVMDGPSPDDSLMYGRCLKPFQFGPLCYALGLAVKCQQVIRTHVACLFLWCGPDAISRLVAKLVVLSFQRMTRRWSWTHVCEKGSKVFAPSATHSDTSSSILSEARRFRILAALNHSCPCV